MNFLCRFIPNFVEKAHHIVDMMKGKSSFHWSVEGKSTFNEIKETIAHALVLVCPDYTKGFIIYSYASEHIMFTILMQKNEEGIDSPIAFMRSPLKSYELKYYEMEKHAFIVVKQRNISSSIFLILILLFWSLIQLSSQF